MQGQVATIRERRQCIHLLDNILSVGFSDIHVDNGAVIDNISHIPRGRLVKCGRIITHRPCAGAVWSGRIAGDVHRFLAIPSSVHRLRVYDAV